MISLARDKSLSRSEWATLALVGVVFGRVEGFLARVAAIKDVVAVVAGGVACSAGYASA
jgi:hypothetical protein